MIRTLTTMEGLEFEIEIDYWPGEEPTQSDPGYYPEAECLSVSYAGVTFTKVQRDTFIEEYGEEALTEWMLDEAGAQMKESSAQLLYEQRKDMLRGVA